MTEAALPGRLQVRLSKLKDGTLGYQIVELVGKGETVPVLREFSVDWKQEERAEEVHAAATAFALSHNAKHQSRIHLLLPAFGARDNAMKLHWIVADDGSDAVRVACGKYVHVVAAPVKISDARAQGLLDTWGIYRVCKKCWRSPTFRTAMVAEPS